MAQVNLAMQGAPISPAVLIKAVAFWDSAEAKQLWPGEALYFNQGNALGALERRQDAIKRYEAALAINPDVAQCWENLGNALIAEGNRPAAKECFDKALSIEPNLFEALYSLAAFAIRDEDFESAFSYLNQVSISKLSPPRQAAIYWWKANALLRVHRYAEGIANAEDAIANSPRSEWGWEIAGRLYALMRREDKRWLSPALNFWQRFVARHPNSAQAWAELGFVYWSLRESKGRDEFLHQGLEAFEKSIELGLKDNGLVFDRIGHLYQDQDNWPAAEKAFRKAYTINAAEFGYCLGISMMHLERHSEAMPLLMAAAEQYQPDAMSWLNLAHCYEKTGHIEPGNLQKAESAYKKAIELDPNYPEAWFDLGGYYWNQGNFIDAYSTWERAMEKFPRHADAERVRKLLADPYRRTR
jgi:tetratricopeptide (TPR) repeat protein